MATTVGAGGAGRSQSSSGGGESRHGVRARAEAREAGWKGLGRAAGPLRAGVGALTGTGASGSAS